MGQISLLGFMGNIDVWFVASCGLWVVACDVLLWPVMGAVDDRC